ncbi:MAG: ferrous iron transport protein A [Gammaproteobacteria bacterium]|nr:ferrous iron transport protein A [Gammaproteobacteria bacterium]
MDDAAASIDSPERGDAALALADLRPGVRARVVAVRPEGPSVPAEIAHRLRELGFLPGERVWIVARGPIAREPIAVRVGTGTFALRRVEAACIRVVPDASAGD